MVLTGINRPLNGIMLNLLRTSVVFQGGLCNKSFAAISGDTCSVLEAFQI
jgi:hypothetical protein